MKTMDGIIGVCGSPRSGTSMCMQTLNILGIPMSAPAFIPENEHIKDFNPKGFYEMNLQDGIKDKSFKGMAVKFFGGQLIRTPKHLISRLIYITRKDTDALISYERIKGYLPSTVSSTHEIFEANRRCILNYIDEDTMCVTYEEVCNEPARFVDDLILYLQLKVTRMQRESAINNIKK